MVVVVVVFVMVVEELLHAASELERGEAVRG